MKIAPWLCVAVVLSLLTGCQQPLLENTESAQAVQKRAEKSDNQTDLAKRTPEDRKAAESAEEKPARAASGKVTLLRTPDKGIQPQTVVDAKGVVHMIYFAGEPGHGDNFYVRSDDGEKFSRPLRVNSHADSAIAVGNIRGAHLAVGKAGRVHVAWMGSDKAEPRGPSKAAPMLYTRLNNAGDDFEPQRNIIQ